ncbi:MAG: sugar ABC transporter permease [Treponema sp.]|nr:sugar ABC transporter permease [Treponema sp.]
MGYPIVESFRLSFFRSNGTAESFRGLTNYAFIITSPIFGKAIFNTLFITFFQLLIAIPAGFVTALLINDLVWVKCKNFLKSLFFIPYITPAVAAAVIFLFVLHPDGILNMILGWVGLNRHIPWREGEMSARFGAVFLSVWQSLGFNVIILLAYLQSIPSDYYEAAALDGCGKIQLHRHITLPRMRGALWFLFLMGWINGFQRFTDVFILGNKSGSPNRSLLTMVGYIYDQGFGSFSFGMAAAASWILFAIILIFTLLNLRLNKEGL